jgi:peroxiredoxin Q/BCP
MGVAVGDEAPDFTLPATGGEEVSLSSFRGRPVVLVFYPGDDTPVCTVQLTSYNDDLSEFEDVGAQILGVSPQDVASHEAFSAKHGFSFPLLADTDKAVGSRTACSDRSGSTGGRCSSSTAPGSSGTCTAPWPA